MNQFPVDYVAHNLPLILISGLESAKNGPSEENSKQRGVLYEGGFRIRTDEPPVRTQVAEYLLQAFLDHDGFEPEATGRVARNTDTKLFKIKNIGRTYTLPARKAPPPPHTPWQSPSIDGLNTPPALVLHSPLSPLTPSSPLYADGIFTPLWITKHQSRLPAAVIFCFTLTADPNKSSLEDNKLKSEINELRNVLNSTNYKTKLVVILMADGPIDSSGLDDRLGTIKRSTTLESKRFHFLAPNTSQAEISEFATQLLTSLHPLCVEYYRDLSKHARRKRSRSVVPPPTVHPGVARMLPTQGWIVRYEFKLGVLAEFRQEMDAAYRNFEAAYDSLFAPDMFEATPSWSPRFNEARMLADVIAIRVIRCLLWTGQGSLAVRFWSTHRNKVQDVLNRRGRGTSNYGWQAWQSTWSKLMADLISGSPKPIIPSDPVGVASVYLQSDNTGVGGERIVPWEQLHHEGYWLNLSRQFTQIRREKSLQIPLEDREPMDRSPASAIASKTPSYDTYLTLEPHEEHPSDEKRGYDYSNDIIVSLDSAMKYFSKTGQLRMVEILELKKAIEYVQSSSWTAAMEILRRLWQSQQWREAGWWDLLQHVGWALIDCASQVKDPETIIQLTWELCSKVFTRKPYLKDDLHHILDAIELTGSKPAVALSAHQTTARVVPTFAFCSEEGHVGELVDCQLVLQSHALPESSPVEISEIKIVFDGGFKPIYIVADQAQVESDEPANARFVDVPLQDSSSVTVDEHKRSSATAIASLVGHAKLTLSPGEVRVLGLKIAPREAGDVSVASITLIIDTEKYGLTITTSNFEEARNEWWEMRGKIPVQRLLGKERSVSTIRVLPKPPKMTIQAIGIEKSYYTNEDIELVLEITNNEEESATGTIQAKLISPLEHTAKIKWSDIDQPADVQTQEITVVSLPAREIEEIMPGTNQKFTVLLTETIAPVDHEFEVEITYKLASDDEAVLTQVLTIDLGIVRPFEANYDFLPRPNEESWPNFFKVPKPLSETPTPLGLKQNYMVTSSLHSFTTDAVVIETILLAATKVVGSATCSSSSGKVKQSQGSNKSTEDTISAQMEPNESLDFNFDLLIQNSNLGDRHTVTVDLALQIGWRRVNSDKVNSSILEVPRLVVPAAEPRVMLTTRKELVEDTLSGLYHLNFIIENPSMHFLTFNVGMESNEDFAFSGPKSVTLSLVPISRRELGYSILPLKRQAWVKVHLNVVDAYFGQTLRVQPAGEGVKVDKKDGLLIWVE